MAHNSFKVRSISSLFSSTNVFQVVTEIILSICFFLYYSMVFSFVNGQIFSFIDPFLLTKPKFASIFIVTFLLELFL